MGREFDVVLYGATSTTARYATALLIEEKLKKSSFNFALSGRCPKKLKKLSFDYTQEYDLKEYIQVRIASLDGEIQSLRALTMTCNIIINFAGPYKNRCEKLVQACLDTNTHYLDASGELSWCYLLKLRFNQTAKENHVMIMPCLATLFAPSEMLFSIMRQQCDYKTWKQCEKTLIVSRQ